MALSSLSPKEGTRINILISLAKKKIISRNDKLLAKAFKSLPLLKSLRRTACLKDKAVNQKKMVYDYTSRHRVQYAFTEISILGASAI